MLGEEVEEAVRSLKAGVDIIPSELLKNGGDAITMSVLTAICQKIWETKEWPREWTQSLVIPFTKEKQPQAVSELPYRQPNQQDHARSYPQPTQSQG